MLNLGVSFNHDIQNPLPMNSICCDFEKKQNKYLNID